MKLSISKHASDRILSRTGLGIAMDCVRALLIAVLLIGASGLQAETINITDTTAVSSIIAALESSAASDSDAGNSSEMSAMVDCCTEELDCSIDCAMGCSATSTAAATSAWTLFPTVYAEYPSAAHYLAAVSAPPDTLFRPPII